MRVSSDILNAYALVVAWSTVSLMLILAWILALKSQSIDFYNAYAQSDIPKRGKFYIELPTDFTCDKL